MQHFTEIPDAVMAPPVLLEPALVVEHLEDFILLERANGDRVALRYWTVPAWVADGDVVTLAVEGRYETAGFAKHYGPPNVVESRFWVVDSPSREVVMTREGFEAA